MFVAICNTLYLNLKKRVGLVCPQDSIHVPICNTWVYNMIYIPVYDVFYMECLMSYTILFNVYELYGIGLLNYLYMKL